MFITKEGKYRRMDIIMPQYEELAYCLISWTGQPKHHLQQRDVGGLFACCQI